MMWIRIAATSALAASILWLGLGRGPIGTDRLRVFATRPAVAPKAEADAAFLLRLDAAETLSLFPQPRDPADGVGAAPDAGQLRLQGVSSSPGRRAALVSAGGATAQWIAIGAPAAGLELVDLRATEAVVRTSTGQTVTLQLFPSIEASPEANP